jgi:hypothetical protein
MIKNIMDTGFSKDGIVPCVAITSTVSLEAAKKL